MLSCGLGLNHDNCKAKPVGSQIQTPTLSCEASFFVVAFILKRSVTDVLTFSTLQHKFEDQLKVASDIFLPHRLSGIALFFPLFKLFVIHIS